MLEQERLDCSGELHVQIEKVHRESHHKKSQHHSHKAQNNFPNYFHISSLPGLLIRQHFQRGVDGFFAEYGTHVVIYLIAHTLS